MPDYTIRLQRLSLTPVLEGSLFAAISDGTGVSIEWEIVVQDAVSTSRIAQVTRAVSAGDINASALTIAETTTFAVTNLQSIEVRFALNRGQVVVGRVNRIIQPPFAGRTEESPGTATSPPEYVLHWTGRNSHDPELVRRTGHSAVDRTQPQNVQANWALVRNDLATIQSQRRTCFNEPPALTDSLIVDVKEYTSPVADFRNWSHAGWTQRGVFHQQRRVTTCRAKSDIDAIVLHETAAWGQLELGWPGGRAWLNGYGRTGTDHPADPDQRYTRCSAVHPATPIHRAQVAAHFCVHTDGSIAQHYDPVQRLGHAPGHNARSVGIEITNGMWATNNNVDANNTLRLPNRMLVADGTRWDTVTCWIRGHQRYVVPSRQALESYYQLVRDLMFLLEIPDTWRALSTNAGADRFLMDRWPGNMPAAAGVYAHFNIGNHSDGTFIALYTWLRHHRNFCSLHAREQAMQLCNGFPNGQWQTHNNRRYLDVSGVVNHVRVATCSAD